MKAFVVGGYALTAVFYLLTWWRPSGGLRNDLLQWVSFSRLCLAEFLSVHAATLLGAVVFVRLSEKSEPFDAIFWVLAAFYGLLALGAYLMHRSHRALFSFYLLIAIRAAQFFTVDAADIDMIRAEVVKNFMMSVPMMILVAVITMSDDMLTPWQEKFLKSETLWQRIVRGRAILAAAAYFLLWSYVELKWPERLSQ